MKLTGAVISNNYENSIQKREDKIKNIDISKKETSSSEVSDLGPSNSVSKFESIGIANLEKSKYYQTQISLLQKGEKGVDDLNSAIFKLEDLNKQSMTEVEKSQKIQEIIKGIEILTKGEEFIKNEVLSNVNLQSLGLNDYISNSEKDKILNEALAKTRIKSNELIVARENKENELTKVRLASENLKAANSKIVDESNLDESLKNVKSSLESKPIELNGNLSQQRVMNILNS